MSRKEPTEEVKKIMELITEGLSDKEIVAATGYSISKIRKVRYYGFLPIEQDRRYKLNDTDVERIKHLRELGWTYTRIGAEFNVHYSTIRAIFHPRKYKSRSHVDTELSNASLRRRHELVGLGKNPKKKGTSK